MTEEVTSDDGVLQLAKEYRASLNSDVDQSRKDDLQQEIDDYEGRYEGLVQEHGEDHKLAKKARKLVDRRREELQELEELEEAFGSTRDDLLEVVVDDFELDEQWLQTEVVEAVNHALHGQKISSYTLFGEEIANLEDLDGLDAFDQIEREEVVILLAKDKLGQSDAVEEQYKRLEESKSFSVFEVLAEYGNLDSATVAEKLDEDKGTVNNWLKSPINFWDRLIPFYRPKKGEYALSMTGLYFYEQFYTGEVDSVEETESEEGDNSESDDDPSDTQSTLGATSSSLNPPDEGNSSGGEVDDSGLSDIEDTEEKAEAMFSKISDTTEN